MRAHGTHACYVWGPESGAGAGCRCEPCRESNRRYEAERKARVAPAYVGADTSRQHLRFLIERGVGLKTVAKRSGLAYSSLQKIHYGPTKRVRVETQDKILAVTVQDAADGAYIPAGRTWEIIEELLERGWTKVRIAESIGQSRALQLSRSRVTAGNARAVEALLDQPVPPRRVRGGLRPVENREPPEREPVEPPAPLRLDTISQAAWRREAACRMPDVPVWIFFPGRGDVETTEAAKAVCDRCASRSDCLEAHLFEKFGIWGGTTERERRRIRRERGLDDDQADDESEAA